MKHIRGFNTKLDLRQLLFLSILLPFASPFPIPTDTQPLAFGISLILLLRSKKLPTNAIYLLFLGAGTLVYFSIYGDPLTNRIGQYLALFSGICIFVVVRMNYAFFRVEILKFAIWVYFLFSLGLIFLPNIFYNLQMKFVRGINVDVDEMFGYRGLSTLAPEPGLLGGTLVFILITLRLFFDNGYFTKKSYAFYSILVTTVIILTKSGTGYLYFLIYAFYIFVFKTSYKIKIFLIFATALIISISNISILNLFENNRGFDAIWIIFSFGNLLLDTSIYGRLMDIYIGLVSLVNSPLGFGINNLTTGTDEIVDKSALIYDYYGEGSVGLVSGLSILFVGYGLYTALILSLIFFFTKKIPWFNKFYALLLLTVSFSPAFPPIYFLLAFPARKN